MCSKCDYSSTSRINFKAHVARSHGKTVNGEDAAKKVETTEQLVVRGSQVQGGFQPMLPLYATAANLQSTVVPAGLPVYHLTVKGPDHHIFTFHPSAHHHHPAQMGVAKPDLGGGGGGLVAAAYSHHQVPKVGVGPQQAFLPLVSKTGDYSYQQQQQGHQPPATTSAPVSAEGVWRPEYDSYLSSV